MQRFQDKCTLFHPRMRKFKSGLTDFEIAYQQNIQIQRPGAISNPA